MIINNIMERRTPQKQKVLDYLKGVYIHPSAQIVYFAVKKKVPNISKATVYRILKNLVVKKEIQEIPAEVSRYDGDNSSHAHFICEKCNRIYDLKDFCQDCTILKNKKTKVGKINKYTVNFYGICKKC